VPGFPGELSKKLLAAGVWTPPSYDFTHDRLCNVFHDHTTMLRIERFEINATACHSVEPLYDVAILGPRNDYAPFAVSASH
jgi:hypothetical protein